MTSSKTRHETTRLDNNGDTLDRIMVSACGKLRAGNSELIATIADSVRDLDCTIVIASSLADYASPHRVGVCTGIDLISAAASSPLFSYCASALLPQLQIFA